MCLSVGQSHGCAVVVSIALGGSNGIRRRRRRRTTTVRRRRRWVKRRWESAVVEEFLCIFMDDPPVRFGSVQLSSVLYLADS